MVVGDDVTIFGDEEAGALSDGTKRTLAVTVAIRTTLGAILVRTTEFLEEALQRMVIRQLVEATAAKIEGEIAGVIGSGLHVRLYANGDDGGRYRIDHVGEAWNLRRIHLDGSGERVEDRGGDAGGKHQRRKAANGRGLQSRLQRGRLQRGMAVLRMRHGVPSFFIQTGPRLTGGEAVDDEDIGGDTLRRSV
ncbi:hypothetical protein D3C87_1067400 [compost metagenome]